MNCSKPKNTTYPLTDVAVGYESVLDAFKENFESGREEAATFTVFYSTLCDIF